MGRGRRRRRPTGDRDPDRPRRPGGRRTRPSGGASRRAPSSRTRSRAGSGRSVPRRWGRRARRRGRARGRAGGGVLVRLGRLRGGIVLAAERGGVVGALRHDVRLGREEARYRAHALRVRLGRRHRGGDRGGRVDGARRTPRGDRSARSNRERARRFRSKSFDTRCREGLQPGGPALKFHALVRIRRVAGTRRRAGRARAVGSSDGRGRVAARRALGRRARQVRRASRPFLPPPNVLRRVRAKRRRSSTSILFPRAGFPPVRALTDRLPAPTRRAGAARARASRRSGTLSYRPWTSRPPRNPRSGRSPRVWRTSRAPSR